MRIVDADELKGYFEELAEDRDIGFGEVGRMITVKIEHVINVISTSTTIKTKQIKYFDEDEKIWRIGEVIVDE